MPVDASLAGRTFPPTPAYDVTEQAVGDFAAATGTPYTSGGPAPATFPIVVAFAAMNGFLEAEQVDLFRIVHGEQRFSYHRAVEPGDVLSATLTVATLRKIGGADIIGTSSVITDQSGAEVCTGVSTLVHRAEA
jgi:acyl dehydratase